MITLFPVACEDELDFSIFARCCARKPYWSKRSFVEEFFGKGTAIATVGLTSNLAYLMRELAPGHPYTIDTFINEHTFLPYHALFLEPQQVARLREDMCAGNGPGIHMRAGLMASKLPFPPVLKLCPTCITRDRQQHGFCYWHRAHQPFGVEVCAMHDAPLIQTDVPTINRQTRYEFVTAEHALEGMDSIVTPAPHPCHAVLSELARSVAWSLKQLSWAPGSTFLQERYLALLEQQGFVTAGRRVRIAALLDRFRTMYPEGLQRRLQCELDETSDDTWLARLVRRPKHTQHPLYHLLLMHLLGYSAEGFFTSTIEQKTFGDGPWPCLNPVCESYHQLCIPSCTVRRSRFTEGRPVGMFSCPHCSFIYARTWSTDKVDPFQRQRIVEVGPVWEGWLSSQWGDDTYSLRSLARHLGVDTNTVREHAMRLGLCFPRPSGNAPAPIASTDSSCDDDLRETNRRIWIAARQKHPDAGVNMLRSIIPTRVYTWLYRNDKEWLDLHSAPKQRILRNANRIKWDERDKKIAVQIHAAAQAIRELPDRPRQITVTAIGQNIGQLALLQRHLDHLPLTRAKLDEVVETRIAWAVRRIHYVRDQARENNISLLRWQFIRTAGVERLLGELVVQEELARAVTIFRTHIGEIRHGREE